MRNGVISAGLLIVATIGAFLFLGFLAGAASMYFDGPYAAQLERTFKSLQQVPAVTANKEEPWTIYKSPGVWSGIKPVKPEDWINPPAPESEPGVYILKNDKVQAGLTLYTPIFSYMPVRLIDFEGNSVHEWTLPDITDLPRDDDITFARTPKPAITDIHLYPNGNLLVQLTHDLGYQPYGFGIAMLDKNSKLLWQYLKQAHHQIDVASDGRIAVMVSQVKKTKPEGLEKVKTPYIDEDIIILSPSGEELAKASLLESIRKSAWSGMFMFANPNNMDGDLFHLNAAKFLTAEQAAHLPNAKAGDLLLSLRNMDLLAVLDPSAGEIVWAMRGPWHRQHDPHVTKDGTIMLYDNKGDLRRGSRSRVIEVNPESHEIVWEWPRDVDYDLYTSVCGAIEPLKNGNTLIAETNKGRLLEVARDGEIVWQYQVPESIKFWDYQTTKVWHPRRFTVAELPFLQQP